MTKLDGQSTSAEPTTLSWVCALREMGVTQRQLDVASVLCNVAVDGVAELSVMEIGRLSCTCRRVVFKNLRILENLGAIRRVQRKTPHGARIANAYIIMSDKKSPTQIGKAIASATSADVVVKRAKLETKKATAASVAGRKAAAKQRRKTLSKKYGEQVEYIFSAEFERAGRAKYGAQYDTLMQDANEMGVWWSMLLRHFKGRGKFAKANLNIKESLRLAAHLANRSNPIDEGGVVHPKAFLLAQFLHRETMVQSGNTIESVPLPRANFLCSERAWQIFKSWFWLAHEKLDALQGMHNWEHQQRQQVDISADVKTHILGEVNERKEHGRRHIIVEKHGSPTACMDVYGYCATSTVCPTCPLKDECRQLYLIRKPWMVLYTESILSAEEAAVFRRQYTNKTEQSRSLARKAIQEGRVNADFMQDFK